jgi:hypothetical protein
MGFLLLSIFLECPIREPRYLIYGSFTSLPRATVAVVRANNPTPPKKS